MCESRMTLWNSSSMCIMTSFVLDSDAAAMDTHSALVAALTAASIASSYAKPLAALGWELRDLHKLSPTALGRVADDAHMPALQKRKFVEHFHVAPTSRTSSSPILSRAARSAQSPALHAVQVPQTVSSRGPATTRKPMAWAARSAQSPALHAVQAPQTGSSRRPAATRKPMAAHPPLAARLSAAEEAGRARVAQIRSAQTARRPPETVAPPRLPPAPLQNCSQRIGSMPRASAFTFHEEADCLVNVAAFAQALNAIGPWPTSWHEQQPAAIHAYNRLQRLPLPVGGLRDTCRRIALDGEPLDTLLHPARWSSAACFWFGRLQKRIIDSGALTACAAECASCETLYATSNSLAHFRCERAQPQGWLLPAHAEATGKRLSAPPPLSSRARSTACDFPAKGQVGLLLPSLSPLLPLAKLHTGPTGQISHGASRGHVGSTNWCVGNVSAASSRWSLEGRSRYATWPNLNNAPFLSGGVLRSHADLVLFDFESVAFGEQESAPSGAAAEARATVVYVRAGHAVARFFNDLAPKLRGPYVLITGGTDACAPPANLEHKLEDPKLVAWFARNPATVHPKLQPLPTGVDSGNATLYTRALALAARVRKDRLVYASFTVRADSSSRDRQDALSAVRKLGGKTTAAFWHVSPPSCPKWRTFST